jgi:arsenate reductase (thioredoxin)
VTTTVLFACVENAGRSQMAAGFFNALTDLQQAHAISAGTKPAARVHPEVVAMMREVGIDVSEHTPQRLTEQLATTVQLLVTMGCGETCPYVPGLRRIDWTIADPKRQPPDRVREIRDDIRQHIERLITTEGWHKKE